MHYPNAGMSVSPTISAHGSNSPLTSANGDYDEISNPSSRSGPRSNNSDNAPQQMQSEAGTTIETNTHMSIITKKETYFTAPSGRRYLVYDDFTLTEEQSSKIYSTLKKKFPNAES